MYMYVPPQGILWSSSSFPEEQCSVYWPHSNAILSLKSGGFLLPEEVLQPSFLQCCKMPLLKIGEMERVQYKVKFLPFLSPMEEGRGGSYLSCSPPSVGINSRKEVK